MVVTHGNHAWSGMGKSPITQTSNAKWCPFCAAGMCNGLIAGDMIKCHPLLN